LSVGVGTRVGVRVARGVDVGTGVKVARGVGVLGTGVHVQVGGGVPVAVDVGVNDATTAISEGGNGLIGMRGTKKMMREQIIMITASPKLITANRL